MASIFEEFWTYDRYAFVGNSAAAGFPAISFKALKAQGKTAYPVDPSVEQIEGEKAYRDFDGLPEKVEAVVLEVPKKETAKWVERAADAGIKHVWIHMNRDTPEALRIAQERGVVIRHGTCAVQYVRGGFPHSFHKLLRKLTGNW